MADLKKRRLPPLVAVFLIVAVDILAFTLILPLLPFYAQDYGASPWMVGVLATSFAVAQMISGPWLGRLSDRIGRKPVLVVSQVGTFTGFLMLAFAPNLFWVFLSRVLDGITAGNLTIAQAVIADVTVPEKRTKAFGVIGVAFGLGFLVGPALSALLVTIDKRLPALAAAALSALSILATITLLPRSERQVQASEQMKSLGRLKAAYQNVNLRKLFLLFLIFGFIFAGFTSGFAMFVERRYTFNGVPFGPREVGWLFAYSGLLGLIVQGFLLGRLVKWLGENRLVTIGFLTMGFGYLGLGATQSIPVLIAAMTVGSFGSGLLRPALTALVSQAANATEQGAVLGITQTLTGLGQIFAPLIAGYFIDRGAVHVAWLWGWCLWLGGLASVGLFVQFFLRGQSAGTASVHRSN